jgi:hypothetical protein
VIALAPGPNRSAIEGEGSPSKYYGEVVESAIILENASSPSPRLMRSDALIGALGWGHKVRRGGALELGGAS